MTCGRFVPSRQHRISCNTESDLCSGAHVWFTDKYVDAGGRPVLWCGVMCKHNRSCAAANS